MVDDPASLKGIKQSQPELHDTKVILGSNLSFPIPLTINSDSSNRNIRTNLTLDTAPWT